MDENIFYDLLLIRIGGNPEHRSLTKAAKCRRKNYYSIKQALERLTVERKNLTTIKDELLKLVSSQLVLASGETLEVSEDHVNKWYKKGLTKLSNLRRTLNLYLKECVTPEDLGWESEEEAKRLIKTKDWYTIIEKLNLRDSDIQRGFISNFLSKKDDYLEYQLSCWYEDIYGSYLG